MNSNNPVVRNYRLPQGRIVRRSRDRYLYDQNGSRYLDIWLSDGASFLGHRPGGYGRLVKEESDRGLWGPFPTQWPGRLRRALRELSGPAGCDPDAFRIVNGRFSPIFAAGIRRWLPAGPSMEAAASTTPVTVDIVLPAPGVIVPDDAVPEALPALSVALLTWAAHALALYLSSDQCRSREQTAADLPSPPGYRRGGVWFTPEEKAHRPTAGPVAAASDGPSADGTESVQLEQWEGRRASALVCGILVPPDPWTPLVVPDGMQSADRRNWERMCHEWTK